MKYSEGKIRKNSNERNGIDLRVKPATNEAQLIRLQRSRRIHRLLNWLIPRGGGQEEEEEDCVGRESFISKLNVKCGKTEYNEDRF